MREQATRLIVSQAWPILLGQFAGMAHSVVDTVMSGHVSATDLAAVGLGGHIYGSVFISLMGVVTALNPIVAQHYGGEREREVGESFMQGLWLALGLGLFGFPLLASGPLWLHRLGSPVEVNAEVARYLLILAFALPGGLLFRAVYAFNTALSRPRRMMLVQVAGMSLKVLLNYVFLFGPFGLPKLGARGCAYASLIVLWLLFAFALTATLRERSYARYQLRFALPSPRVLREQLRLGVPMGAGYAIESTSFSFMALLAARLGTTAIAGQQVIMNLAGLCYQVPLALGIATATATAQAIGAGSHAQAKHVSIAGLRLGLMLCSCISLLVWVLRERVVGLYTGEPAVAAVALSLIVYLALFHLFDGLQSITGFVLRAYKIAVAPTVIVAVSLWGIGLVGGYFVAFRPPFGAARGITGMWLMQAVALFLTAAILLYFYAYVARDFEARAGEGDK